MYRFLGGFHDLDCLKGHRDGREQISSKLTALAPKFTCCIDTELLTLMGYLVTLTKMVQGSGDKIHPDILSKFSI